MPLGGTLSPEVFWSPSREGATSYFVLSIPSQNERSRREQTTLPDSTACQALPGRTLGCGADLGVSVQDPNRHDVEGMLMKEGWCLLVGSFLRKREWCCSHWLRKTLRALPVSQSDRFFRSPGWVHADHGQGGRAAGTPERRSRFRDQRRKTSERGKRRGLVVLSLSHFRVLENLGREARGLGAIGTEGPWGRRRVGGEVAAGLEGRGPDSWAQTSQPPASLQRLRASLAFPAQN